MQSTRTATHRHLSPFTTCITAGERSVGEEAAPHSPAQHFNPAKTPCRTFDEYQVLGGSPRADTELMTRFAEEITEVLKRLRSPIWYPLCESPSSLNQFSINSRVQGQGG